MCLNTVSYTFSHFQRDLATKPPSKCIYRPEVVIFDVDVVWKFATGLNNSQTTADYFRLLGSKIGSPQNTLKSSVQRVSPKAETIILISFHGRFTRLYNVPFGISRANVDVDSFLAPVGSLLIPIKSLLNPYESLLIPIIPY